MSWLQVQLETRADCADAAESALLEVGATAVTLQDNADQPLYAGDTPSETLWKQTRISGLFPASINVDSTLEHLRLSNAIDPDAIATLRAEILEDKDWEREWMQHYSPLQISDGFWLCPSWLTPPEPDSVNLMLDPGLAFGTGTHPTTRLCLEALTRYTPLQGDVVDFGCGSGILSVASLLLGASRVLATDTDPQALAATWANAERNHIDAGRLSALHPDALDGTEQADLVVANILMGPLCDLAPQLVSMLQRPTSTLLLSGVLEQQVAALQQAYPIPLQVADRREGWVVLIGQGGTERA
ncbi:MAG: 50S ribosomal protein L11 methyltransferase [Pseudomonadota bacterium]